MSDSAEQKPQSLEDIFGPPIYAYTRADAIADGVLVPIPELDAKLAGFTLPLVASATVYAAAEAEDFAMRQAMLAQCRAALAKPGAKDTDRVCFDLHLPRRDAMRVVLHVGPGDAGEPVLTLCEPSEL